jgi:hypothetical protein
MFEPLITIFLKYLLLKFSIFKNYNFFYFNKTLSIRIDKNFFTLSRRKIRLFLSKKKSFWDFHQNFFGQIDHEESKNHGLETHLHHDSDNRNRKISIPHKNRVKIDFIIWKYQIDNEDSENRGHETLISILRAPGLKAT